MKHIWSVIAYEMGLHKWLILSKHAEDEKEYALMLKKLGCLFESFLGALFLDIHIKRVVNDDRWMVSRYVRYWIRVSQWNQKNLN